MFQLPQADAKFLEEHNAAAKFASRKPAGHIEPQGIPSCAIIDRSTKRRWVGWTEGTDKEDAFKNAITAARESLGSKPVTPADAAREHPKLKSRIEELEAQVADLEKQNTGKGTK